MTCVCKRCGIEKPLSEFYKTSDRKSGHKTICKACIKADPLTEERKAKMRVYGRDYHLKTQYNMTREEHTKLLVAQNHKCAICGIDEADSVKQKLYVDHCHTTGKVRALLCHSCNAGIGLFKESIPALANAIAYLDKHNTIKE
jgi:HKD family nuclease